MSSWCPTLALQISMASSILYDLRDNGSGSLQTLKIGMHLRDQELGAPSTTSRQGPEWNSDFGKPVTMIQCYLYAAVALGRARRNQFARLRHHLALYDWPSPFVCILFIACWFPHACWVGLPWGRCRACIVCVVSLVCGWSGGKVGWLRCGAPFYFLRS